MSTALIKGIGGVTICNRLSTNTSTTSITRAPRPCQSPLRKIPELTSRSETSADSDKSSAPLTAHLRSAADKLFSYVDKTGFTTLGSIGVLLMLITVTLLFDTIEKAMNTIWHVQAGRSPLRKVTDYLSLLLLMPLAINIGFAATTILKSPALLARTEPFLRHDQPATPIFTLVADSVYHPGPGNQLYGLFPTRSDPSPPLLVRSGRFSRLSPRILSSACRLGSPTTTPFTAPLPPSPCF